ncbi:hypothetical protein pb186bvf_000552 [Paramecium bursaria]
MTNDETFFVRMGGKRRDQIMLRLQSKSPDDRSPSYKSKEHSKFSQHLLNMAIKSKIGSQVSSLHTSQRSIKTRMNVIDLSPKTQTTSPQTPNYFSSRQKLIFLLQKSKVE